MGMSSHKAIQIYMGGVNTLYRLFCFFKLFPIVGKGLITQKINFNPLEPQLWIEKGYVTAL